MTRKWMNMHMYWKTHHQHLKYKKVLNSYANNRYKNYDTLCNSIIYKSRIKQTFEVSEACRMVMGYLKHIEENGSSKDSVNKCKYLYFWLHNDLSPHKTDRYNTLNLYKGLLEAYNAIGTYPHICNDYMEDIKKIKLSYANKLMQLYSTYKTEQDSSNKCYCVCAKKCYDLHKLWAQDCHNDKDEDFCNELENFKYIYDRNMLYVGTCGNAPKTLDSVKGNVPHSPIVFPLMLILAMQSLLFILYK
ncbi:PIR protein, partial [Plasmodium vivax]